MSMSIVKTVQYRTRNGMHARYMKKTTAAGRKNRQYLAQQLKKHRREH